MKIKSNQIKIALLGLMLMFMFVNSYAKCDENSCSGSGCSCTYIPILETQKDATCYCSKGTAAALEAQGWTGKNGNPYKLTGKTKTIPSKNEAYIQYEYQDANNPKAPTNHLYEKK